MGGVFSMSSDEIVKIDKELSEVDIKLSNAKSAFVKERDSLVNTLNTTEKKINVMVPPTEPVKLKTYNTFAGSVNTLKLKLKTPPATEMKTGNNVIRVNAETKMQNVETPTDPVKMGGTRRSKRILRKSSKRFQ